jgi:hypothetical protein
VCVCVCFELCVCVCVCVCVCIIIYIYALYIYTLFDVIFINSAAALRPILPHEKGLRALSPPHEEGASSG